jgi:hypothetical protein
MPTTIDRRRFLSELATTVAIVGGAAPGCAHLAVTGSRRRNMPSSLQLISDRIELEDLVVRYCYAIDDRDWAAYRDVFTPDAVLDDTVTGGIRSGVDDHVVYLTRALSRILISQHDISTVLVDLEDTQAKVRAHCSCPMVVDLGSGRTQVFFQGLQYRIRAARTERGWKVKELTEEQYWNHNLPIGFKF